MHQFGWVSERDWGGGNLFNLLQKEGGSLRKGGGGGFNPGGNFVAGRGLSARVWGL